MRNRDAGGRAACAAAERVQRRATAARRGASARRGVPQLARPALREGTRRGWHGHERAAGARIGTTALLHAAHAERCMPSVRDLGYCRAEAPYHERSKRRVRPLVAFLAALHSLVPTRRVQKTKPQVVAVAEMTALHPGVQSRQLVQEKGAKPKETQLAQPTGVPGDASQRERRVSKSSVTGLHHERPKQRSVRPNEKKPNCAAVSSSRIDEPPRPGQGAPGNRRHVSSSPPAQHAHRAPIACPRTTAIELGPQNAMPSRRRTTARVLSPAPAC